MGSHRELNGTHDTRFAADYKSDGACIDLRIFFPAHGGLRMEGYCLRSLSLSKGRRVLGQGSHVLDFFGSRLL